VLGTVLMVAVTVALAVVLFVFVSPMLAAPPPPGPELSILAGQWNNGTITLTFSGLTRTDNLQPQDLRYALQSANGTTYFFGPAGSVTAIANITVMVDYLDGGGPERVTGGDVIRITVNVADMPTIHGCSFKILYLNNVIGTVPALP
jgi:FlaG/FlaF family flagellin (archaellin)